MVRSVSETAGRLPQELRRARREVLRIAEKHGASHVRVFGSFARGDQHKDSDIDLLVDLPLSADLFELVGLQQELEGALGRKVDVVPEDSLKPALRPGILSESRPL